MCKVDCKDHSPEQKQAVEDFNKLIGSKLGITPARLMHGPTPEENHKALTELCEGWSAETASNRDFANILRMYVRTYKVSVPGLADQFEVATHTINHWKDGVVIPHLLVQKHIVTYITKTIKEKEVPQ